jgi:hypothetical protein
MNTIATTIKTPRHFDANRPFGATPMTKQAIKPTDPDKLEICSDPLPAGRANPGNKYEALYSQLTLGQCIKCQPGEVGRVANSLRKWVKGQRQGGTVRSIRDYGDGKGRVWWIAAQPKAKPASH